MRNNSMPSSKKCSSPSAPLKSLPKIKSDELIFKSFYPVSAKPATERFFEDTGVFHVALLRWNFRKWRSYDRLIQPNCCSDRDLIEKCPRCTRYHEKQQKLVKFAVSRIHERISKLVSPHLTIRTIRKSTLIFNNITTNSLRGKTNLHDYLQRLVLYMQIWSDKSEFGVHSNLGLYCLFMVYEHLKLLTKEKKISLTRFNIHNIIATGMVIACKYAADEVIKNNWWATVAEIDELLLNKFEKEYFFLLDFNVDVSETNLVKLYKSTIPNLESILEDMNNDMPDSDDVC